MQKGLIHTVVANVGLLTIDRAAQVGSTLLTSALIARGVGVEAFGQWQFSASILFLLATLSNFASSEVTIPALVAGGRQAQSTATAALLLRSCASALFLLVGAVIAFFLLDGQEQLLLLLFVPLLFREPLLVVYMWCVADSDVKPYFYVSAISLVVRVLSTLLVYVLDLPVFWYFVPLYAENVVYVCGLFLTGRKVGIGNFLELPPGAAKQLAIDSLWIWMSGVCMIAAQRLDRMLLGNYVDPHAFGNYSASAQINDNWIYLGILLSSVLAPRLIYGVADRLVFRNTIKVTAVVACVCLASASIIWLASGVLAPVLYGAEFVDVEAILRYTVWVYALVPIEMMLTLPFLRRRDFRWVTFKSVSVFAIVAVGIPVLSPTFGVLGPSIAIGVAYAFAIVASTTKLTLAALRQRC